MKNSYNLRDIRFTGGRDERGTDIQYYEIMGPDKLRFYTGIQAKKRNLTISATTELINQGTQAFDKDIIDTNEGRSYRLNRWIVATTGDIKQPAREEIHKQLDRYAKPITFWDGVKVGEFILDNFYPEFVSILNIDQQVAGMSSGIINWWDPDEPLIVSTNFKGTEWSRIDISDAVPPVSAGGIFLTIKPTGGSLPPIKCAVRSSEDELLIESFQSQINPYLLRLKDGETSIEAILVEGDRPVELLAKGYLFFR